MQGNTRRGLALTTAATRCPMCCFVMLDGIVTRTSVGSPLFLAFFFSSLMAFFLVPVRHFHVHGPGGSGEGESLDAWSVAGGVLGRHYFDLSASWAWLGLFVIRIIYGPVVSAFQVWRYHLTCGDCVCRCQSAV
jgi:hypothetical protein